MTIGDYPFFDIVTIALFLDEDFQKTRSAICNQSDIQIRHIIVLPSYYEILSGGPSVSEIKNQGAVCETIFVNQSARGITNAFNGALPALKSPFVIFLNAGDQFFDKNVCSNIKSSISARSCCWYYGGCISYSKSGRQLRSRMHRRNLSLDDFFYRNPVNHQSTVYSLELLQKVGQYNESLALEMDYDFNIRCAKVCAGQHLPIIVARFDASGASSMRPVLHWNYYRSVRDSHFTLPLYRKYYANLLSFLKLLLRITYIPIKSS